MVYSAVPFAYGLHCCIAVQVLFVLVFSIGMCFLRYCCGHRLDLTELSY